MRVLRNKDRPSKVNNDQRCTTIFNNFHRLSTISNKIQNSKCWLEGLDLASEMAMKAYFKTDILSTYGFARVFSVGR